MSLHHSAHGSRGNILEFVASMLEAQGLKVVRVSAQHAVVAFDVGHERRQSVHLLPAGDIDGAPVLAVLSIAAQLDEPLSAQELLQLLLENGSHKVGYWGIFHFEDSHFLAIAHNMPLDAIEPATFLRLITTLACEADLRERSFSQGDRF